MFWQMFKESMIIQAALAFLFSSAVTWLYVNGQPVPEPLVSLVTLILGFYFGQKSGIAAESHVRRTSDQIQAILKAAIRSDQNQKQD